VKNSQAASSRPQPLSDARQQRVVRLGSGASRTVIDAPFSRFAESIRAIKLAVDLNGAGKSTKVIGLTSSVPREGKSTVAAALGELMAQGGARVILVDCDLRNPSLSRALAPNAVHGILEVISGNKSLQETIWKDPLTNMAFLPAVTHARLANTSQILGSDETGRLFDVLRTNYDYIIVDLSPIAPVVDVRATTHLLDSFILLIEWGQTRIDVVQHALRDAPEISDNILGVVLNKVDMNNIGRYEVYRAKYYRNKYFARYGYED
jgi:succinoglycan biosynthesis transport protein ExoP